MEDIKKEVEKVKGFVISVAEYNGEQALLIQHRIIYNHPPLGPTSRCRIITGQAGQPQEYVIHIMLKEVECSIVSSSTNFLHSLLSKYSPYSSNFKFCPGIDELTYKDFRVIVPFDPKSLRRVECPILRIDSKSCLLWFELGKYVPVATRELDFVGC
uniref:Uncharacterized protein n=1 Tax=Amphimedon queenslandica TaxID=400682 RepID=A0A1X7VFY3_AMPQE